VAAKRPLTAGHLALLLLVVFSLRARRRRLLARSRDDLRPHAVA
jgi:hypothetical protein